MILARGTIPQFLVEFCKDFKLEKFILDKITLCVLKDSFIYLQKSLF